MPLVVSREAGVARNDLVANDEQHQRSSTRRPGVRGERCIGAPVLAHALLRVSPTARTRHLRRRDAWERGVSGLYEVAWVRHLA